MIRGGGCGGGVALADAVPEAMLVAVTILPVRINGVVMMGRIERLDPGPRGAIATVLDV